jgi:hypothetical protein
MMKEELEWLMKVGDLVMFRNCALEGMAVTGLITQCSHPSHIDKKDPRLALYWVLSETGEQCFTGNQLELA